MPRSLLSPLAPLRFPSWGGDGAGLLPVHTGSDVTASLWGAEPAYLGVKAGSTPCALCGLGQVAHTFSVSPGTDTAWKTGASCSGRRGEVNGLCLQSAQNRIGPQRAPCSRSAAGPARCAAWPRSVGESVFLCHVSSLPFLRVRSEL